MKNLLKLAAIAGFCFAMIVIGACGGGGGGSSGSYTVTVTGTAISGTATAEALTTAENTATGTSH